jgi:predicted ABC-type ATPase
MKNRAEKKGQPTVYIISGPNGAGKTTFALEFLPKIAGCRNFINVDLIARGLSPLNAEAASITE